MERCDFCIIGAGVAGLSAGAELALAGRVVVLEREDAPARHATGRSAALFTEFYGNATVRALTRASREFLERPPQDAFARSPLTPRGVLYVASAAQRAAIEALAAELRSSGGDPQPVSGGEVRARVPVVSGADSGLLEPEARDIDAGGLVDGYLRLLRARGGELRRNAELRGIVRRGARLVAQFAGGELEAGTLVNAAGAWAGEVGALAAALPIRFAPLRRTAFTIDLPEGVQARDWPCVIDVEERLYFKPDAGRLLVSPADETPSVPCDAQPEDLDVALAVERLEALTSLQVARVRARWAGLRTFAPDRTPVVGFDPREPGFFWLAGQGGYGLQTSPAMARAASALATRSGWPADLAAQGVRLEALAPDRFA